MRKSRRGDLSGVTPSSFLYDDKRVFGGPFESVSLKKTGQEVVRQPRLESEELRQTSFLCPTDRIPMFKVPNYMAPSRQAETIFVYDCVDVTAGTWDPVYGITPSETNVLSFETFAGMKTVVHRVETIVHDSLYPHYLDTRMTINGSPVKLVAQPGDGTAITPSTPPTSGGYVDMIEMPVGVANVTRELFDRARIDVSVSNSAPTPRVVCISVWGWIEPITSLDDRYKV